MSVPFHASRRRALVVAYDFPPHGAIGTMRTLRVVQRLAEDGWDVKVLTSDPRGFRFDTPVDEALLERIPSTVTVVRATALRGFDASKKLVRRTLQRRRGVHRPAVMHNVRQAAATRNRAGRAIDLIDAILAIPDNESAWLAPAVTRGLSVCRQWRPDVLYSSAPPWTGHAVARILAAALSCPWVADFRDPWARAPGRNPGRINRWANHLLEQTVIRRADAVLFVTRANLVEFSTFYGADIARRFHFVPNGCDPSEFETIAAAPTGDRFVLLHAGSLYEWRNPLSLIRHIATAIERGAISRERFRLRLLGPIVLDVDLAAECRRLGLDDVVQLVPRVSRREGLREMASASALLLLQPATTVSVPGKAYEYLASRRPVLAVTEDGETAELIRASGMGISIPPDAGHEAVEATLRQLIDMASKPCPPPLPALYDGRVHAGTTVKLLSQLARSGQACTNTSDIVSPAAATGSVRPGGPRQ